ncbi:nuclease-related domain-containing protein [Pseudokineococcus sp. 1T1Z-3]|uniref:nuclease-related domain-containing protein n=1 Tax=Pseudokineococcus sp. 1T1Z-3 TaxID=3132745 RepID=UPI0030AF95F0
MRASWRRRMRRRYAAFFGGYLVLGLVPAHAVAATTGMAAWLYCAGAILGAGLALFVVMRDTPPAQTAQWELGAFAEQWTAKELRPLRRRGWTVLHDRRLHPDGPENVDHVLTGPCGTYVLDSKRRPGTIHVDDRGRATVTSHDAPELVSTREVGGAARGLGIAVHTHLGLGHSSWVQAVVVLWGDFPQQVVEVGRVVYVAGPHLREWLRALPPKTQPAHPDEIAAALRQALPAA